MVRRRNKVKVVFILALFLAVFVFSQDKQVNDDKHKKLREEILAAYKSRGEKGLRNFAKKKKDKISNKFILEFAESGVKERKEEWLKACKIIAEEKNDEKTLGAILYKIGEYFRLISNIKKAIDSFDKALLTYQKLNDPGGQGNVYLSKGELYLRTGENTKSLKMFDKALPFLEKTKDFIGQGDVCLAKGTNFYYMGDNSKALEWYEKALLFFRIAKSERGQGNVYLRKGDIHLRIGEYSRALDMYNKTLTFFEKIKSPQGQGSVHLRKGDIYLRIGKNSKALEMYNRALPFFEKVGSPIGQGNVYKSIGDIYFFTGDNLKAIAMYDKALPFYEKAGTPIGQGNLHKSKGDIYLRIGKISDAIEMYDKALLFFKKIGDSVGLGNVYRRKGDIYLRINKNPKALEMYNKALSFFQKAGDPLGQGNVYLRRGITYFLIGDNSKAIEMYGEALTFFEKVKDPISQGNIYQRVGDIYLRIGKNSKALEMYDKALQFFEQAKELIGQGNVYWRMGDIYLRVDENSKALEMYNKALPFFQKAEEPIGQGNTYQRIGDIYLKIGENSKALKMYDKALPFFEQSNEAIGQGNIHMRKGENYIRTGKYSLAFVMFDKALPFFKKAGEPIGQANVHMRKGDIYFYVGDNANALEMYDKALSIFGRVGDIEGKSIVLHGKAKALVKLKKQDEALELFEEGIANREKVRFYTAFSEMKKTLMERVYKQYEETALFMLDNKYYDKSFRYAESMKARVFLDRMAEGLVRLDKGLIPDLKVKRDKMVAKLSLLSKEIHATAGKKDEKKLQELKENYQKVESEFEELLVKIRLSNPLYASVRYPQPVSTQELQKEILKKGEPLVSYFISTDKIYVFLISKENFKVIPLKVKEKEVENIVKRYLLAVKENISRDMMRFGKALYKKLFRPVETELNVNRNIIIIPDGELTKISFDSFVIDKKKSGSPVFLLEKYRIKYIQSASILSLLRKYYTRKGDVNSFIGFGDPVYDYENFKQGKPEQGTITHFTGEGDEIRGIHCSRYARSGGILDRLPGSGEEVKAIARLFEKESSKNVLHTREQATEDNAKEQQMRDFDFIHFACHGLLNDNFQSMVLSQDVPGAKEDGYFTLNEVMNCDYNAKLVVLSACQTGSGKMYKGEGITGLTRAVMYAGTPAVVASLWKVDDIATKELMVNFYRNMLEKNMDKVEALRQAKLELLQNKKYRSPLFWSAFVMYGE